jgi:DNA-binding transcriptional ArsR family regulator
VSIEPDSEARARDALHAAQLYYVQDQTMDQIATEMKLSRSSVSRLLSYAREIGLVEITVHSPQEANSVVARRLAERYGISVHVVSTPPRSTDAERLERTARTAAHVLSTTLDPQASIGIAWGATVSAIARHLPTKRLRESQIVQMNGAANESTSGISYSGAILERFGQAFGTDVQQFPVPALFDDPHTKQLLWRERSIRRVVEAQARVQRGAGCAEEAPTSFEIDAVVRVATVGRAAPSRHETGVAQFPQVVRDEVLRLTHRLRQLADATVGGGELGEQVPPNRVTCELEEDGRACLHVPHITSN